jgi:ABC-type multidrug transport system ATPase subunit
MRFSARLRLDRSISHEEIEQLVNEILQELGLEGCADTMIGGGVMTSGGLSGGEKKRTQCGVELVTKPGIIILDEPTSGLDSFSAEQLVDVLKRIARVGAGVLITIHQPPPTVVRKIDHLIMLLDGRLMYDGSADRNLLSEYFAEKGYPKPEDYNIADWIMVSSGIAFFAVSFLKILYDF